MTSLVESCLEITAAFQEGITFSDRMSIFKRWVNRMEFRPTFIDGDSHDVRDFFLLIIYFETKKK